MEERFTRPKMVRQEKIALYGLLGSSYLDSLAIIRATQLLLLAL
jgi:hypothetical protein